MLNQPGVVKTHKEGVHRHRFAIFRGEVVVGLSNESFDSVTKVLYMLLGELFRFRKRKHGSSGQVWTVLEVFKFRNKLRIGGPFRVS